jgi:ribosomal protein L40E
MEEKDISSGEELENMLQKAFLNIRKNNHAFLGTIEIEGNGFERNVFDECELGWEDVEKLMNIHIERRQTIQFPELTEESFIAIKYFGNEEVIDFIANSDSQGMLEIASDMQRDDRYKKGMLCGIICVDLEASYFFVLSNNFMNLDEEEPKLTIDQRILERMYEQIENAGLTPVSWFKIRFGFKCFESLFLWEEIKDGAVVPLIKDNYDFYIKKLLKTKAQEDSLKSLVESEMPDIRPNICPHCGKKNPPIATMCIGCNQKLE